MKSRHPCILVLEGHGEQSLWEVPVASHLGWRMGFPLEGQTVLTRTAAPFLQHCPPAAVVEANVVAWRAGVRSRPFVKRFSAEANEFEGMNLGTMREAVGEFFDCNTVASGRQRIEEAVIFLELGDGELLLLLWSREGGLMGGPFVVGTWVRSAQASVGRLKRAMGRWRCRQRRTCGDGFGQHLSCGFIVPYVC